MNKKLMGKYMMPCDDGGDIRDSNERVIRLSRDNYR